MLKFLLSQVNTSGESNLIVQTRQRLSLIIASIISIIATLVDIFQNYDHGFKTLAYIEIVLVLIYFINYITFSVTNRVNTHAVIYALSFTFHIVVSFIVMGYGVDIMLFLLAVLPVVLFLLLKTKDALRTLYLVSAILIVLTANSYYQWTPPLFHFDIFIQLVLIFPFYVILVYMVERSRINAEKTVIDQNREKEVLLKEVHHRVKNNMQVIMSLLWLQSEKIEDKTYAKYFLENIDRLSAMALVHESIYKAENFEHINMKDYLERILSNLSKASLHQVKCELEPISVDMKSAMNLGLIVNEVVTNAFEHAYGKNQEGVVSIYLDESDDEIILKIKDFGRGFDSSVDISKSLGMTLIYDLASSLEESDVIINSNDGVEVLVRFKKAR